MKKTFTVKNRRVVASSSSAGKQPADSVRSVDESLCILKENIAASKENYREKSLSIHGLICANCAREFESHNRHLLTVHHKDGNHHNNPPDGSNWDNLCVYCHEATHSREMLGEYLSKETATKGEQAKTIYSDTKKTLSNTMEDKLKAFLNKKENK